MRPLALTLLHLAILALTGEHQACTARRQAPLHHSLPVRVLAVLHLDTAHRAESPKMPIHTALAQPAIDDQARRLLRLMPGQIQQDRQAVGVAARARAQPTEQAQVPHQSGNLNSPVNHRRQKKRRRSPPQQESDGVPISDIGRRRLWNLCA